MTTIAILPAFNEEVSIGSMVLHARQHVDHVMVIDDGSNDRTSEVATLAGAEVIRHPNTEKKSNMLSCPDPNVAQAIKRDSNNNPWNPS